MAVFRTAHYDAEGNLVRVSEAFPVGDAMGPQTVADLSARAADTGSSFTAGAFLVWRDRSVQPPERIDAASDPDGRRSYGGHHPPVRPVSW